MNAKLKSSNRPTLALIVDDEPDICELAEITLNRMGIDTCSAADIASALQLLATKKFDLCITDMNLPDGDGIELVEHIQTNNSNLPVAVITAYGNMQSAVRALKAGAFDFVSKPIDLQVFRELVNSAIKLSTTPVPPPTDTSPDKNHQLLGQSQQMQILREKINRLSRSQAPVFIHGESGCGKELVANLIHQQGMRSEAPFIAVNCGAIPMELMESEFFGHKKGSFTGAIADKDGLFKAADKGTLFLDEVADLPIQMQVKLLRAIQEKSIRAIGHSEEQSVDVRILSASHKDLSQLVKQGLFREDLFYRINVIELPVPPLRDRREDIPELTTQLLKRIAFKSNLTTIPKLSESSLTKLSQYSFPGNVRELENILERSIALMDGDELHIDELVKTSNASLAKTQEKPVETQIPADNPGVDFHLASQEKDTITQALEKTRWNKTAAAKLLGLTPRQLSYRMKKLNVS